MAAAYNYCEGDGPKPGLLTLAEYINRFGVEAVMGRSVLSAGELKRMVVTENIVYAYRERARAENWAKWTQENPDKAQFLNEAARLANGE